MEIDYTTKALADLDFWKKSGNKVVQKKIILLLDALEVAPFEGIGKPEALKENLSGFWSRRITAEHRMVYRVEKDKIIIFQLRYHY